MNEPDLAERARMAVHKRRLDPPKKAAPNGYAYAGLVLALVIITLLVVGSTGIVRIKSLVVGPIGLIFAGLGGWLSTMGLKSRFKGVAITGIVLSGIGIIGCAIATLFMFKMP